MRHKQHIDHDPFNPNNREYNYPLSRGIRKYGKEEYELIIIENDLDPNQLDEREKYWIDYYNTYWNGYNQTIGGTFPTQPIFSEETINIVIEMLKDYSFSFQDIIDKTGLSLTHIYNINTGQRRKRSNIQYPIRPKNAKGSKGIKFDSQENKAIHEMIINSSYSLKQIAEKFHVAYSTICDINAGRTKAYRLSEYQYPLRTKTQLHATNKTKLSNKEIQEIHALLLDTNKTMADIGKKYNVAKSTISLINLGKTKSYKLDGITYPIRQTNFNE